MTMATRTPGWKIVMTALAALVCLAGAPARADDNALAKYIGRWDVRVKNLQPKGPDVTYIENYQWVLQRKFIRATTEGKSDGTEDLIVAGYDPKTKGYPFWIFSSSGTYVYLPSAAWDARQRIMTWENPPQMDITYRLRCIFPDDNNRRCTLITKDWKGKVLIEQESSAVRRKD
jgi:uncharacterized protein DUF1579